MDPDHSLTPGTSEPFLDRLKREIPLWVSEGVVTEAESQRILARYGEEYQAKIKIQRQGRLTQIISVLGAVLVGVGVLLFIGANWTEMPTGIKLMLIFGSIAVAYGSGIWLTAVGYEKTGSALVFLGALLYGAGIALIAQIYHLPANSGMIFLLWASGVFLSGLALRSPLLLAFSAMLFTAWTVFSHSTGSFIFFNFGWRETIHAWYLIPSALLFASAYWLRQEAVLGTSVLGILVWFGLAIFQWGAEPLLAVVFFLIMGVLLLLLAALHSAFLSYPRRFFLPFSFLGATAVLVPSYLLSFNQLLNGFRTVQLAEVETPFWVLLGAIAVIAFLGSLVIAAFPRFIPFVRGGFLCLAALVAFSLIFIFFPYAPAQPPPGDYAADYVYQQAFNPYMLVWNIVLALEIIGIIVMGYFANERRYVNIGILFFVLQVMSRYFDVFAFYFGTYASFIIGGILFILLGVFLERFRRRIIQRIAANAGGGGMTAPPAPGPVIGMP